MEERLTSEAYLTQEMEKLLDLNKQLSTQNDFVTKQLNVEKEQIKELIEIHLGYEDELEERWSEIINNVEGTYFLTSKQIIKYLKKYAVSRISYKFTSYPLLIQRPKLMN